MGEQHRVDFVAKLADLRASRVAAASSPSVTSPAPDFGGFLTYVNHWELELSTAARRVTSYMTHDDLGGIHASTSRQTTQALPPDAGD